MNRKKNITNAFCFTMFVCVLLWGGFATKVDARVMKVGISAEKNVVAYQETIQLKAQIMTKGKSRYKNVTWGSSDENLATVDSKGYVTGKGCGQVTIYAKCEGVTGSIKITVVRYQILDSGEEKQVIIYSNGKPRKYTIYIEELYNGTYGKISGCNVTSAAIILSGLVDESINPETVHLGEDKHSERYAIRKLKKNYSDYDSMSLQKRLEIVNKSHPTLRMLEQIFQNSGLKTKYVRKITEDSYNEAYEHLAQGNPIIFTTNRTKSYQGIKLARGWHTMVALGLDKDGKAIIANPKEGSLNYTYATNEKIHLSISEILENFEQSCKKKTQLYSGDRFGYILVSK